MLSFNPPRRAVQTSVLFVVGFLLASQALSACGFRPLYGQQSTQPATQAMLASIDVKLIPDRSGQIMRTELTRRFAPIRAGAPLYALSVGLGESITELSIERDAFATRANLSLTASYQLIRNADGQELTSGRIRTVSSYNILSSDYATLAAQQDARKRGIETLAEDLHTRLSIYFNSASPQALQPRAAAPRP